ncbi:MAG: hypothetical protein NTY33_02365 [Candidatus Moranbacteria bacterium]|nr:hypothetical protein [Candidatus Moranbacteria bacterium]
MKTKVFFVVLISILSMCASAVAGNFWIGKIPEPGSSEALFSQSAEAGKIWIGDIPGSGSKEGEMLANERNSDPCGFLAKWGLVLTVWQGGNAEHGMTSAEIIVFATEENDGNVVAMLTGAQKLIIARQGWSSDFEYRLLESMGYGSGQSNRCKWYGNSPNYIGTSYQYALEKSRGLTFEEAFLKFTYGQGNWKEFQDIYAAYARFINEHLGLNTSYSPRPGSSGYYHDFSVTPENRDKYIAAVQLLLEKANSPLADKELFTKSGTPSIINYDAPEKFCQCQ